MQNKTVKNYMGIFFLGIILIAIFKTWNTEFIGKFFSLLTPLFVGIIMAYILCKPCAKLEALIRKIPSRLLGKCARVLSILLVYIIAAGILYLGMRLLIPVLFSNAASLLMQLPSAFEQAIEFIESHEFMGYSFDRETALSSLAQTISFDTILGYLNFESISGYIKGIVNVSSTLINAFIGIIISVYLLLEKDGFFKLGNRLLACIFSPAVTSDIVKYLRKVNEFIGRYIYCRFLDATIMFFITLAALLILDVRYAIVLATIVAVCNIVPYIGSIISTIILIGVTLFSEGPQRAVVVGIMMLVLQQIDGNIIDPFIVKDRLKISPVWVIIAVIVGGGFGGIIGIMVGVPVVAVIRLIGNDLLHRREVVIKYRERHNVTQIHFFGSEK